MGALDARFHHHEFRVFVHISRMTATCLPNGNGKKLLAIGYFVNAGPDTVP
jgi:hypothetical protein